VVRAKVIVAEDNILARLANPDHTLLISCLRGYLMRRTLARFDGFFPIPERIIRAIS
jgi:hypothetical protein